MAIDTARFEAQLRARRDELNAKLHKLENALDREPAKDAEDRATEREDDEVMEGLGKSGLAEVRMIDLALVRIENGTYGLCANCGEEIGEKRLALVPHAPLCVKCA